jgi:hypothetical protein
MASLHSRILLLHEIGQIKALQEFLSSSTVGNTSPIIIALDDEVERALQLLSIDFVSGRSFRTKDTEGIVNGEAWSTRILRSSQWSFFSYRDVALPELYFLSLQGYLTHVLYYIDILSNICRAYKDIEEIIIFSPPSSGPVRGSALVHHQVHAYIDAVSLVAKERHISVQLRTTASTKAVQNNRTWFQLKRSLFTISIALLNKVVRFTQSKRKIRILASDYWKNLTPYIKDLESAEILMIDRKEVFKVGIRNLFRFKMQFVHAEDFCSKAPGEKKRVETIIREGWLAYKKSPELDIFSYRGIQLRSILEQALSTIVEDACIRVLNDIDDTYEMLTKLKPHVVILRSTVSTQTHFVVLAHAARSLGIPSIEMQHGLEYYGPGSVSLSHRAEFTGVYGSLTKAQMEAVNDTHTTALLIGSPRFDVYLQERKESSAQTERDEFIIVCIAPAIDPGGDSPDTYDAYEYYAAIAQSVKDIPHVRVIFISIIRIRRISSRGGGLRKSNNKRATPP